MINKNRIIASILIIIIFLSALAKPTIILAADTTDYDFIDELNVSRTGIGFRWTASTKTLTITALINENADIKLPTNSTIDIQGDKENIVKHIKCEGNLTIKGNDVAKLKIPKMHQVYKSEAGVNLEAVNAWNGDIVFESGNLEIGTYANGDKVNLSYGIWAQNFTMNGGNIIIDHRVYGQSSTYSIAGLCAPKTVIINNGNLTINSNNKYAIRAEETIINSGNVVLTKTGSDSHTLLGTKLYINGGSITASSKLGRVGLSSTPNINPKFEWTILHNTDADTEEGAKTVEIYEIYNMMKEGRKFLKISLKNPNAVVPTTGKVTTDAEDYDFTDELSKSRTGIGFRWTASTKILTITALINENADIKLPANSTIDIQGDKENIVKHIECAGNLTIKGNEVAKLKIPKMHQVYKSEAGVNLEAVNAWSGDIVFESGNLEIGTYANGDKVNLSYGIWAQNFTMNGGNIIIDHRVYGQSSTYSIIGLYAPKTVIINNGNLTINSNNRYAIRAEETIINSGNVVLTKTGLESHTLLGTKLYINGGSITASTKGERVSMPMPNINPRFEWSILYNNEADTEEGAKTAELYEIYNFIKENHKFIKISLKNPNAVVPTTGKVTTDAEDYDFTDELSVSRTGIGFKWEAKTRTLSITALINENADVKLPENSIIEILGNKENIVKHIKCEGNLTIKGNEVAKLKIPTMCQVGQTNAGVNLEGIFVTGDILYSSGNVEIGGKSGSGTTLKSYGVYAKNFTMNGGNLLIDHIVYGQASVHAIVGLRVSNAIIINNGDLTVNSKNKCAIEAEETTINGGNITVKMNSTETNTLLRTNVSINGGSITGSSKGGKIFNSTPNINPEQEWIILRNTNADTEEGAETAEIYDIYNIMKENNQFMKISLNKPTTSISISSEKATIFEGDKTKFIANIEPKDSTEAINWKSSDISIATVSNNGEVTGIAQGKATITAESGDFSATKEINVIKKVVNVGEQQTTVKYGTASTTSYTITSNFTGTYTVKMENLPEGVTLENNNLEFQEVANGQYSGTIRLNILNTAQATTITNLKIIISDSIVSNDFKIQIDKADSIYEKVPTAKVIEYNEKEQELIEAGTTNDGTIQYSIDGTNFTNTIPKAKQVGKYNVYYRIIGDSNHLNSDVSMLEVIIEKAPEIEITEVILDKSELSLEKGKTETLTATINPNNTTQSKTITWSSDKPAVATVDNAGKITAVSAGIATITATTSNGKKATCTVTVTNPVPPEVAITGVTLNKTSLSLEKGKTSTLTATINPNNTTQSKTITWSSDKPAVATVDNAGKITAVSAGIATITATTSNGKKATCTVTVTNPTTPEKPTDPVNPTPTTILGDTDGNEKITTKDAKMVLQHIVKKIKLTEEQIKRADADKNEKITTKDAKMILQHIVKKIILK